jgi:polyadenylate-binding protein
MDSRYTGCIFVKGLDETIDDSALQEAFSTFGSILFVKVVHHTSGQSTGCGFIWFHDQEDARDAIDFADGTLLRNIKISVATFKSRDEV